MNWIGFQIERLEAAERGMAYARKMTQRFRPKRVISKEEAMRKIAEKNGGRLPPALGGGRWRDEPAIERR